MTESTETDRLRALAAYRVLDTPAEAGFDDLAALAAQICDTPVALVSLLDRDRQWFKARFGFPLCGTGLQQSLCVHALTEDELLVIPDLENDARTRENTLVTGEHHFRFYAGAVLKTPAGVRFGTLCVIDTAIRPAGLTPPQAKALTTLARQVVSLLELRNALDEREAADALLRRDADRHDALLELGSVIGAARGDLDVILDSVVATALRVVPAANGAVVEMRDGTQFVYRAVAGHLAPFLGLRFESAGSLSGHCLDGGTTLSSQDAAKDPRVNADVARRLGIGAMIVAPISRLGTSFGVLKVQSASPGIFTASDIRATEQLAAAVAAGFGDVAETRSVRELRASEAMLRRAQDAAQIGTFSTDIARRVTTASDGFFRLFGLPPTRELAIELWESLLFEEDRPRTTSHLRGEEGGEASYAEYRIRRADTGAVRWIARSADFVRDPTGRVVGLIGIAQDISERRWDELRRALLFDLDDRFKAFDDPAEILSLAVETLGRTLDVTRCGYAEIDETGTQATLTRLWSRRGEPASDPHSSRIDDFGQRLIAELRAGQVVRVSDLRADPRADVGAVATHAKLGTVATMAVPVVQGGRLLAIMFAHHETPRQWADHEARLVSEAAVRTQDAVERARAELALRRSEARLRLAQEVGGIGTFEVQLDNDVLEASVEMFRLYGLPERQGCSTAYFTDLVVEDDRMIVYTPERRRNPETPTTAEYRIRRADDGTLRWMRRVARKIEVKGLSPRLIGVVQDITDRKASEMALGAARDAAEAANRAKSAFLANMSHELRTPLSAVIGYSEMMEEEMEELGQRQLLTDLGKVKSNARHLLGLINDVLDLSKVEAGRMDVFVEEVDIETLVADVAATVDGLVSRKRNALDIRVAGGVGAMRSDGVKIKQCLLNLLGNAAKFTEDGVITLAVERERDEVVFRVSDSGIGMTEAQVGRLFERFSQADETTTRKFGGTGLGLALTRAFADLLGGTVTVESAFGLGTTFTLRLRAALPA